MRLAEAEKLKRDLEQLHKARLKLVDMRYSLDRNKRMTASWLRFRLTQMIMDIDERIGWKQHEIAEAEVRIRLGAHSKKEEALSEEVCNEH